LEQGNPFSKSNSFFFRRTLCRHTLLLLQECGGSRISRPLKAVRQFNFRTKQVKNKISKTFKSKKKEFRRNLILTGSNCRTACSGWDGRTQFDFLFFFCKTALLRRALQERLSIVNDVVWVRKIWYLVLLSAAKRTAYCRAATLLAQLSRENRFF